MDDESERSYFFRPVPPVKLEREGDLSLAAPCSITLYSSQVGIEVTVRARTPELLLRGGQESERKIDLQGDWARMWGKAVEVSLGSLRTTSVGGLMVDGSRIAAQLDYCESALSFPGSFPGRLGTLRMTARGPGEVTRSWILGVNFDPDGGL